MLRFAVVVTLASFAWFGSAFGKDAARTRCPGGRFMAEAPLVTGDAAPEAGAVLLSGGQVSIGGACPATAATVSRTRHGTLIRASWTSCSGLTGRVRLRGVIRPGCATLVGSIRAHRQRSHFTATRQPECGNGIREAGETCDGDACCTSGCDASPDPGCVRTCTSDADCGGGSAGGAFCARPAGQCDGAGVCRSEHLFCTATVEPVCGCDGKTYPNACAAAEHGVNVASPGACGSHACGTIAGIACGDGQFCEENAGECGVADAAGRCVDVPAVCLGILDPVCGCDGNTYVNDCYRRQAGVQKAQDRRCRKQCDDLVCPPGTVPDGTNADGCPDHCVPLPECTVNDDCSADSATGAFCAARIGQCDGPGLCLPRPAVCPEIFAPVCGCDGETYSNLCVAAGHGVRVERVGPCSCTAPVCDPPGRPVDTNNDGCPDDCRIPCHRACDCYATPGLEFSQACPLDCPNCGDFWTCEEGTCVEHCGPVPPNNDQCQVPPSFCAGNAECPDGQFCACGIGTCNGPGICIDRPAVCTDESDPVCGCDGQTYANPCAAASAGARVASRGKCECQDVTCADGEKAVDTNNDGCADTCERTCQTYCDCGPAPAADPNGSVCPLLACPSPGCGSFWTCEAGVCQARCGVLPPRHACPVPGACSSAADCADGEVCRVQGCGAPGVCTPRFVCTQQYDPVCGCDGKTYGNRCDAESRGVGVAHGGACGDPCEARKDCKPNPPIPVP